MNRIFPMMFLLSLFLFEANGVQTRGDKNAIKGGKFTLGFPGYPKSILAYLAHDSLSGTVDSLVLETLIDVDLETYETIPLLASEWKVSKDKKTFTFKINQAARFSDGKPVTAEDVKFTWDTIMDKKNKTAPYRAYYASYEGCKVIDKYTL